MVIFKFNNKQIQKYFKLDYRLEYSTNYHNDYETDSWCHTVRLRQSREIYGTY